eukprot:s996_g15.t1
MLLESTVLLICVCQIRVAPTCSNPLEVLGDVNDTPSPLYLGCWQQPCKCRFCQGIQLSFARPASKLTSPVTYVFMTQSDETTIQCSRPDSERLILDS